MVVENSFYEHEEHGLVKVIDVTNGVVSFEKQEKEVYTTAGKIPGGAKQSIDGFKCDVEPADVTISADAAVFNLAGLKQ